MDLKNKLFFLFLVAMTLFSCQTATLSNARQQYLRGEYFSASETYRKVYRNLKPSQRPLRGVVAYEMGESYRRMNNVARAATAYANAIRYNYPDTLMHLYLGQMLHKEGKYRQAEAAYRKILTLDSCNILGKNGLQGCQKAIVWKSDPTRYIVKRMDVFNSNRGEFSPMLAQNDAVIYITSSRDDARGDSISNITGMKNNDIFLISKNDKGAWLKPSIIESEINTKFDEGTVSISASGDYLYYTFSPINYNHPTATKIYYSQRGGNSWNAGQELILSQHDTTSLFAHPSISPSGNYLYFVSDMPGGYGGKDIWRAGMEGNNVLFVENLGADINTPADELFPFVRNDSTLYFSSEGHPGMGGLDLFRAERNATGWIVKNLKYPINSSMDDFGITFAKDSECGFFSSNRGDARGRDHIYSFEYPSTKITVKGRATDTDNQPIPSAKVSVIDAEGRQSEYRTNPEGEYSFEAKQGVRYLLLSSAKGFLNVKKTLTTAAEEKDSTYFVDFRMTPYNKPVILENIFYDFDKATLRPESKQDLDQLIVLLNDNPSVSIHLSAHTDRTGPNDYNQSLSLRRAQSVMHYLVEKGIAQQRLSAEGRGEKDPKTVTKSIALKYDFLKEGDVLDEAFIGKLAPEQQAIADQINRRTEFEVTDPDLGLF